MYFSLNYAVLSYSGVREEVFQVCVGNVRLCLINVLQFLPECCSNKLQLWFSNSVPWHLQSLSYDFKDYKVQVLCEVLFLEFSAWVS
jgi:hypothetical protein